jgi:proline dehydrogenase
MSVKMTGLARFALLEKLNDAANYNDVVEGKLSLEGLSPQEKTEWENVEKRIDHICKEAQKTKVGVLIDAEDSWIQHPVDALVTKMMMKYNQTVPVIYNTAQLYRHDRLQFIKDNNEFAKKSQFTNGMKLVRGAYLEKERERAIEKNYPDPINPDKNATDHEYNAAVEYCLNPANNMYTVVGSHNEDSNKFAVELMEKYGMAKNSVNVYFSQLYGMSDNITFNLAKEGCNASKYLPFGPIKDVIPYLMRRAQENSSVSGQTGRELGLIKKEIQRRGI